MNDQVRFVTQRCDQTQALVEELAEELVPQRGHSWQPSMGFLDYQPSDDAFFALFQKLRDQRLIP